MRLLASVRVLIAILAVLVVVWLPSQMSAYHQLEGAGVAVFFIAVLGLNILSGYTGQISLGHGAFMAIGGYTSAILFRDHHWSPIATLPLAALVAFAAGVLVGIPALRLRGVHLALATFGLAVSIPALIRHFSKFTSGPTGIHVPSHTDRYLYVVSWIVAGIMFVLGWLVLRSGIGRSFRAVRDSEVAAASTGVNVYAYKTLAFAISAAFAGVAGVLFVLINNGFAHPDSFTPALSIRILLGAAIAGLGSLWGIVGGAAFVYLIPIWTAGLSKTGGPSLVFQGAAVIVAMLLLPTGLGGLLRRLGQPFANRVLALTNRGWIGS
jgi:branched-chain amino acid transport system permease protein